MNGKVKKVTINDVADAAQVSLATVSRVLNHPEQVKRSTYYQITETMKRLGYAGVQKEELSNVILIIIPNLENAFYTRILDGIFAAADRSNYHFLLRQSMYGRAPSLNTLKKLCEATKAQGIIFLNMVEEQMLHALSGNVAVVQCCECNLNSAFSYVTIDDYAASKKVVHYLASRGKRKIAFINNKYGFKYARERKRGFEDAMKEAGLEINQSWMMTMSNFRYESVISVVTQIFMSDQEHPDAVFAVSDMYGAAAVKAIKNCGLSVPDDVGVVGFDNTFLCDLCDPPLTTVVQPQFQLGNLACEILIETIENPNKRPKQIVLNTDFILRSSV